jgi:hypothetical protein
MYPNGIVLCGYGHYTLTILQSETSLPSYPNKLVEALSAIASWLEALGIEYTRPSRAYALEVLGDGGSTYLAIDKKYRNKGYVFPKELFSGPNRREQGWPAVQEVLEGLGYRTWSPFPREQTDDRLRLRNEFEQVVMRHHVFRDSVNPPNEVMQQYAKDLSNSVRIFWTRNKTLCMKFGYHREDLESFALVWATCFHSKGRLIPVEGQDVTLDNMKLLRGYVKQRFSDMYRQLLRKTKSVAPEGVEDVVRSQLLDGAHNYVFEVPPDDGPAPKAEPSKVPTAYPAWGEPVDMALTRRRVANGRKFKNMMAALPPEKRLRALQNASMEMTGPAKELAERLLAAELRRKQE